MKAEIRAAFGLVGRMLAADCVVCFRLTGLRRAKRSAFGHRDADRNQSELGDITFRLLYPPLCHLSLDSYL